MALSMVANGIASAYLRHLYLSVDTPHYYLRTLTLALLNSLSEENFSFPSSEIRLLLGSSKDASTQKAYPFN
jgi:hypothetical protein